MKRFLVVLTFAAVMLGAMLCLMPQPFANCVEQFSPDAAVYVYCRGTTLNAINMGNGYLVQCSVCAFEQTLQNCVGVDGISVKYVGTKQDVEKLKQWLGLTVQSVQHLDKLQILCAYSPKIREEIFLDGKRVNVQVAFDGEYITVGCPLILDSY